MPLLERDPELALLRRYAAESAAGDGRLVLLEGEAGVGKTALLGELAELCRRDAPREPSAG